MFDMNRLRLAIDHNFENHLLMLLCVLLYLSNSVDLLNNSLLLWNFRQVKEIDFVNLECECVLCDIKSESEF